MDQDSLNICPSYNFLVIYVSLSLLLCIFHNDAYSHLCSDWLFNSCLLSLDCGFFTFFTVSNFRSYLLCHISGSWKLCHCFLKISPHFFYVVANFDGLVTFLLSSAFVSSMVNCYTKCLLRSLSCLITSVHGST